MARVEIDASQYGLRSLLDEFDLPAYVGRTSFQKLTYLTDGDALRARRPDVAIIGAPFDDGVDRGIDGVDRRGGRLRQLSR